MYKQNFKVSWSEENQQYVGLCPKFSSLYCYDKSPVGALRGIRSLVDEAILNQQEIDKKTSAWTVSWVEIRKTRDNQKRPNARRNLDWLAQ